MLTDKSKDFDFSVMSPEVDVLLHVTCSDCPLSELVCLAG